MTSAIVRREIGRTQGFEVKTEGDAFMVAFADALNAVQFALHVQLRLRDAKWPTWLLADPALAARRWGSERTPMPTTPLGPKRLCRTAQ